MEDRDGDSRDVEQKVMGKRDLALGGVSMIAMIIYAYGVWS